jgi:hypothetical protein
MDVAACSAGIRANLVRSIHEGFGRLVFRPGQADIETGGEAENAVRRAEINLGVDGRVSRERDLHYAGHDLDSR